MDGIGLNINISSEAFMKKMKLSTKLIGGFLIVAAIMLAMGIFEIIQMKTIDSASQKLYEEDLVGLENMAKWNEAYLNMRILVVYSIVNKFVAGKDTAEDVKKIKDVEEQANKALADFEKTVNNDQERKLMEELKTESAKYYQVRDQILRFVMEDKKEEAVNYLQTVGTAQGVKVTQLLSQMLNLISESAKQLAKENKATAARATWISIAAIIIGFAIAVILGFFISLSISGLLKRVIAGLSDGADQVSAAAHQVSSSSQHLAEGTAEQASSLEETSSSLEEMSSMTKQNADHANQAKAMMAQAHQIVDKVGHHMRDMAAAVAEITRSSEDTGKIIKTIDEIAFQTNLLALNAAVEAARAGEAGAGFAVVADEVRNLAMRASEAAKNTNNLIENTIKAVRKGNDLTNATQEAFKENAEISKKIGQLVDEIATASEEQAHGIRQVNTAVSEMDKVTQSTAASAEESAAAAEELNAQAEQMKVYVGDLVAVVGGSEAAASVAESAGPGRKKPAAPKKAAVPKKKEQRPLLIAGKKPGKVADPEEVIPLKDGEFKDF
jgi:methyl-accepting chemotaxis protein